MVLLKDFDKTDIDAPRITTTEFRFETTRYSTRSYDQFYGFILSPIEEYRRKGSGYLVVFQKDIDEGGFVVTIPDLEGVVTEGETPDEAYKYLIDALKGWTEIAQDKGLEIPRPNMTI
jgi:predicted RNase H-like HicB family nuclease